MPFFLKGGKNQGWLNTFASKIPKNFLLKEIVLTGIQWVFFLVSFYSPLPFIGIYWSGRNVTCFFCVLNVLTLKKKKRNFIPNESLALKAYFQWEWNFSMRILFNLFLKWKIFSWQRLMHLLMTEAFVIFMNLTSSSLINFQPCQKSTNCSTKNFR